MKDKTSGVVQMGPQVSDMMTGMKTIIHPLELFKTKMILWYSSSLPLYGMYVSDSQFSVLIHFKHTAWNLGKLL